ncbi:hypothetical protein F4808DRAFT_405363 [Astrocystis sublimbata]|nr:hypothetical protein F4808DRAFT_405363 [Astrocystis sublimbata]
MHIYIDIFTHRFLFLNFLCSSFPLILYMIFIALSSLSLMLLGLATSVMGLPTCLHIGTLKHRPYYQNNPTDP